MECELQPVHPNTLRIHHHSCWATLSLAPYTILTACVIKTSYLVEALQLVPFILAWKNPDMDSSLDLMIYLRSNAILRALHKWADLTS